MQDIKTIPSSENPSDALAAVVALRRMADKLERQAVVQALKQGWTWERVAEALGVSKQAAHKRLAGFVPRQS
jgi:transcriptional regulator with GAF, ATPase, and Fis domain